MRIYLQATPSAGEHPKYCQLLLEEDLFGGWSLVKEFGQRGTRPALKREQFLAYEPARQALEKVRDAQLKRGFRILLAPGADPGTVHGSHANA
jgi:hypothetical protein